MISSAAPPGAHVAVPLPAAVTSPVPAQVALEHTELRPAAPLKPPVPKIQFDPQKLQENLKQAIAQLNEQLADSGRTLGFRMDDVLNTPVVTVKSVKTGEVIRQIPSEAVIKAAHTFEQLKGLLVDEMS